MKKDDKIVELPSNLVDDLLKMDPDIISEDIKSPDEISKIEETKVASSPVHEELEGVIDGQKAEDISVVDEIQEAPKPANEAEDPIPKIDIADTSNTDANSEEAQYQEAIERFREQVKKETSEELNKKHSEEIANLTKKIDELTPKEKPSNQRTRIEHTRTDYLFKELPFFRFEWLIYLGVSLIAFLFVVVDLFGIFSLGSIFAAVIMLMSLWAIYLIKIMFYLPTGDKKLVLRFLSSSLAKLTVESCKDGMVHFDKGDEKISPTFITRPNCHIELSSGRPMIVAVENEMENLQINQLVSGERRERSAIEYNSIVKQSFLSGYQSAMTNLLGMKDKLKNYLNIIAYATLALVAITLFIVWTINSGVGRIEEVVNAIHTALPTAVAAASAVGNAAVSVGP